MWSCCWTSSMTQSSRNSSMGEIRYKEQMFCRVELVAEELCGFSPLWGPVRTSPPAAAPAAYFAYFVFFHRNLIGEDSGTNCCPARYTIQLSIGLIFVLTNANTNTNTNANTIANTNTNTDLCNYKLLSFSYICSDKCMKTSVSWVGSSARQNSGGNDEKEKFNWSAGQSLLCNYLSKLTTLNPIFQLPHI